MKKQWYVITLFAIVAMLSACAPRVAEMVYPLEHNTSMVLDRADRKVVRIDWGVPLAYMGQTQTNQEVFRGRTNDVVRILVVNQNTREKGWVRENAVVRNPIAKATLLNTELVYRTPSKLSREFFSMVAPMIGYVVEIQEEWARVLWYMDAYRVFTGRTERTTHEWIPLSKISTNSQDADMLAVSYLSSKKLSEWQKQWPKLTEQQRTGVSNDIEKEILFLQSAMENYPKATTQGYVLTLINSLRDIVAFQKPEMTEEDVFLMDEGPVLQEEF